MRGWGFSSVVERLPSKHKALGSVLSIKTKQQQTNKQKSKPKTNKQTKNLRKQKTALGNFYQHCKPWYNLPNKYRQTILTNISPACVNVV